MKYSKTIYANSPKPTGCNPWALWYYNRWILFYYCIFLFFLPFPAMAQRVETEAAVGNPFGVARISIELPDSMLPQPLGLEGLALADSQGRVFYPAVEMSTVPKIVKEVLESDTPLTSGGPVREQVGGLLRGILARPPRTTIYFLFRGEAPLQITLQARMPIPINIMPIPSPTIYERLLGQWWSQYARGPQLFAQKPDYPPLVENYLTALLATRLNLRLPQAKAAKSSYAQLQKELGLNLGTESLRADLVQNRILGLNNLDLPADQPLPVPVESPPLDVPQSTDEVKIEPLANHVPAAWFYVRFGSFSNFLWLQDTLAKWGGDAQNLVALRGLDQRMSERMEKQLILQQTTLGRMLGETVISDVAIIGSDMFFREGAAYGFLFEARSSVILGKSFNSQRSDRIKAGGVSEQKIKIGDKEISYISSPDGTVRSYYAVDGDYHLFTTSRKLAEQFLALGASPGALGKTKEFQHARRLMPLDRKDTVFVYLSDAFFRNFTSPHYRVEMARRLQAVADIELVQLARLAAAGEGQPGRTIEELIKENFLPPGVGPLPDGSRTVMDVREIYNSLRGRRGSFVPVPDMAVDKVTTFEAAEYNLFADFYRTNWGRMDPILVGMQRTSQSGNREQVVVDVLMTPFAPAHFDLLRKYAGPADALRIVPVTGDLAAIDLVMTNQRVFGGLRDFGPPPNIQYGRLLPIGRLRDWLVGYVGSVGDVGVLGFLNLGFSRPDALGYSFSPLGSWRRQWDQFTVFSFHHEVLDAVTPQVRLEQAKRPAQLRVRIDDPTRARIMPLANGWAYNRTRETSLNNLRLMQALNQQLHVPGEECRKTAEFLLDAKLICPLGGEYVYQPGPDNFGRWASTALDKQPARGGILQSAATEGYQAPPWNWFRGLDLEASMNENNLSAHAEIIMQMPAK